MNIIKRITCSRYKLLISALPITIIICLIKIAVYYLGWTFIPKELITFFPSVFTGIIFILGFLLTGVVTDYKESEKIPNEIATSLNIILQEAEIVWKNTVFEDAKNIIIKISKFVPAL